MFPYTTAPAKELIAVTIVTADRGWRALTLAAATTSFTTALPIQTVIKIFIANRYEGFEWRILWRLMVISHTKKKIKFSNIFKKKNWPSSCIAWHVHEPWPWRQKCHRNSFCRLVYAHRRKHREHSRGILTWVCRVRWQVEWMVKWQYWLSC